MTTPQERIEELLADERLGQLSLEDAAELAEARAAGAVDNDPYAIGELLLAMDRAEANSDSLPDSLADRIVASGEAALGMSPVTAGAIGRRKGMLPWAIAAVAAIAAAGLGVASWYFVSENAGQRHAYEAQLASLQQKVESNDMLLTEAKAQVESLRGTATEFEMELADAAARNVRLAERLAEATRDLDTAQLAIARYEQPQDPEVLAFNRERLLEVPDTIRVNWQPFELAGAPAPEQAGVTGDVVWNDELEQGYLRFVGLDPNDPNVEQYQVWVIDERGLEQKVSGGVFDVTDRGEVIVPIDPGIEVGQVALFAVTVEDSGGTWVPDLQRRVVVAPRDG